MYWLCVLSVNLLTHNCVQNILDRMLFLKKNEHFKNWDTGHTNSQTRLPTLNHQHFQKEIKKWVGYTDPQTSKPVFVGKLSQKNKLKTFGFIVMYRGQKI